ncbi:GIY-YIG nuclease family protein [Mycolicibacterium fortuitum]|uniref:GIY-YIG nuclease family protein n=1 Tax=Mycolicibacterium fortuitum TaxID=1766 RepID=UPI00241FAA4D|nr:GIY-YIG nuclease family protein [Mycolicibacterium fortuitum]MDG5771667.1 GIY-YIG nuclease family protein [Mycolicibacterium fortuitum]MDG5782568.1 GIY-YIG nuclease family protein [Mycolicibacterium fortuitum]
MVNISEPTQWEAIASISENPGVYAWYYQPRFTQFDRSALEQLLAKENSPGGVEKFLARHLFRYFEEVPYEVTLHGPLKPTYSGSVVQTRSITPELCQRLADDGQRREVLWNSLELMVPLFAAPLYIGMAKNLRTRLRGHKRLIEGGLENLSKNSRNGENSRRDASFAAEVIQRRMAVERLSVYTLELPPESSSSANDIENLMNRITFPILGRN